jgi:AhpD family alkylhydroperoxidase
VRLALSADVPIVPVVSIGGQETALFLTRGERVARALGLDRRFRLKVLPVSLALPWGLDVGDFFGHIALPAKITIQVLEPIDLHERFGPNPDVDAVYETITGLMQRTLLPMAVAAPPRAEPRTFASPIVAARSFAGVMRRSAPLVAAYLGGRLDPELREHVMVAVSRVNACRGCTFVHERWALRAGATGADLEAIGLGDLASLDERSRAANVYATALTETGFSEPAPTDVAAAAARHLTPSELESVEAVARAMTLANLSVSTLEALAARLSR